MLPRSWRDRRFPPRPLLNSAPAREQLRLTIKEEKARRLEKDLRKKG